MKPFDLKFFETPRTVAEIIAEFEVSETTARTWTKTLMDEGQMFRTAMKPYRFGLNKAAPLPKVKAPSVVEVLAKELGKRPALVRRVLRARGLSAPYAAAEVDAYRKALGI